MIVDSPSLILSPLLGIYSWLPKLKCIPASLRPHKDHIVKVRSRHHITVLISSQLLHRIFPSRKDQKQSEFFLQSFNWDWHVREVGQKVCWDREQIISGRWAGDCYEEEHYAMMAAIPHSLLTALWKTKSVTTDQAEFISGAKISTFVNILGHFDQV